MALFHGNENFTPKSITGSSAKQLERKILKLQRDNHAEFRYISFYFDPIKKEHVAWYYNLTTEEEQLNEVINGTSKE